jgi:tryptophanyl-tRNA synthetase
MTREVARKMKHPKPSLIHFSFLPSLSGVDTKMSSSIIDTCIFLNDKPNQVKKKINKSFSGGQELLEDHKKLGGNPDIDVSYNLLKFFSTDNNKLMELRAGFINGTVSCSDMKNAAINAANDVISEFNIVKAKITDDVIAAFCDDTKKIILK